MLSNNMSDLIKKLEERIFKLEKRVTKLEQNSKSPLKFSSIKLSNVEKNLTEQIDKIGPQNLVVIELKMKPKQSKTDLQNLFRSWGCKKKVLKWFKGGNFNQRLLDNGIVIRDGKNDSEELFSLSRVKGYTKAGDIFKKYSL